MAFTCLQIVQMACQRIGIRAPNAVVTSQDEQVLQILALSNKEGMDLVKQYDWEGLQTEATFTTSAAELQGTLSSIAPGLKFIKNNTMWDHTLRRPVLGPKAQDDWQQAVAMQLTGPYSQYRIKNDNIYFYPIPPAGNTITFEYLSKNWISTSVGGTSNVWTNDADTCLIDDELIIDGIVWRWKAAKGLDYAEDAANYEDNLAISKSRDGSKPRLNMNGATYDISPIVIAPSGTWNV